MVHWGYKSRVVVYSEVILMCRNALPPVWAGHGASPILFVWAGWHCWSQHSECHALTLLSTEIRIKGQSCIRNPLFQDSFLQGVKTLSWCSTCTCTVTLESCSAVTVISTSKPGFLLQYLQRILERNITQGYRFYPLMERQGMSIRTGIFKTLLHYPLYTERVHCMMVNFGFFLTVPASFGSWRRMCCCSHCKILSCQLLSN